MIIGEISITGIFACLNGNVAKIKSTGGKSSLSSSGLYSIKSIIVNSGSSLFSRASRKVAIAFEYSLTKTA